jgi:hypothetical protein
MGDASPAKQVLTDTTQLAERLQNTLTFQLAGALQTTDRKSVV